MAARNPASSRSLYIVLVGLGLLLVAMGLALSPSLGAFADGLKVIATHPALLDFDALAWPGHLGAGFGNSGLLLLLCLLTFALTKTKLGGTQLAAALMVVGFAFYGKSLLNVWFPLIGVFLHALLTKKKPSDVSALAWFATSLAPVFSVLAFGTPALKTGGVWGVVLGALLGILSGLLVGVIAPLLPAMHKGFTLFNGGLAACLAGIFLNAVLKAFSLDHDKYIYMEPGVGATCGYITGQNALLALLLAITFVYLIAAGLALGGAKPFWRLFGYRSKGEDYVERFGAGGALVNMGVIGFAAVGYVFAVGGELCGPIFGCIFTAVGFAAAGVTVLTYLPTLAGVWLAAFLTGGIGGAVAGGGFLAAALEKTSSRGMLLAALFSCGLAPMAGEYGLLGGLFGGFAHALLVPTTGVMHGWMSLYNNGLSPGLIATFLYPIYSRFPKAKHHKKT